LTWGQNSYGGRADFTDAASFSIIAREKNTQLDGRSLPKTGELKPEVIERAIATCGASKKSPQA